MFFGFSLGKLLLLAAIVLIVWYGFKIFARKSAPPVGEEARRGSPPKGIDTVYDPETDTYVPRGEESPRDRRG